MKTTIETTSARETLASAIQTRYGANARLQYVVDRETWYFTPRAQERGVVEGLSLQLAVCQGAGDQEYQEYHDLIAEIRIDWRDLGSLYGSAPKLSFFEDLWPALPLLAPLFDALAALMASDAMAKRCPTLREVRALLDRLGCADVTPRENPYKR